MDFSSVDDFLRQAKASKQGQRHAISIHIQPLLEDIDTYAMPPAAAKALDTCVQQYGDEALRQAAVVAIGKWLEHHEDQLSEHIFNGNTDAALVIRADIANLVQAVRLVSGVGSFSGQDTYVEAMKDQISQSILEALEDGTMAMPVEDLFDDPLR